MPYNILLKRAALDIEEIQSEDAEKIVSKKAEDAYRILQKPVVVSDDSWSIPGLGGFPGAYMKSMNYWLTPEDFIRLTKDLTDRRIFIQQYLAYHDGIKTEVFRHDLPGRLLTEARGISKEATFQITTLDSDNGLSIAEVYNSHKEHALDRYSDQNAWHIFATWYKGNIQQ